MKAALKLQQQFRNHIRKTNSPGWNSNSPKKNRGLAERIQRLFDTIHANSQRLDKLGNSNALVKSKLDEKSRQKDTGSLLKDIIGSYDSTLKEMHDINRDFASLVNSIKNGGISDFDRSVLSGKIYNDVAPGEIQNSAQQIAFLESKILRLINELKMETESRKNLERELIEANQKIEMLGQKHEHETKSYENLMKMLYAKCRDYENKINYLTQKPAGKDAYGKNLPNSQRVGEVVKDLARNKEMEKQILKLLAEKQEDYIAREDALKIANELRISNYHLKQDLTDIEEDNVRLQETIESLKRKIQGLQKEIKGNYEAELRKMLGARKNNSKTLEQLNQELYKKLRKTKGEKETVAAEFEKNKEKVLKLEELIGSKEKEYESLKSNLEAIKAIDSARSQEEDREQLKQEVKAAIIRDLEENLAKEFEDWKNDYERQISGYKAKEQEYDAMLNEYNKIIEKLRGEVEEMRVKSQQAGSPPKSSHRILNESIDSGTVFDKKAYEAALAQAFKERILNPIKSTLKHAKRHLKKKDFESPHFPGNEREKKDG